MTAEQEGEAYHHRIVLVSVDVYENVNTPWTDDDIRDAVRESVRGNNFDLVGVLPTFTVLDESTPGKEIDRLVSPEEYSNDARRQHSR